MRSDRLVVATSLGYHYVLDFISRNCVNPAYLNQSFSGYQMNRTPLSTDEQARLDQLATLLESTPEHVLPFVLRDGFSETERVARAVLRARATATSRSHLIHDDAMARLDAVLARHGSTNAV